MLLAVARGLLAHAFPTLIAQFAFVGMMAADAAVLGHVSRLDLAAEPKIAAYSDDSEVPCGAWPWASPSMSPSTSFRCLADGCRPIV